MNSLVGLGATASFAVSCVAAALPALRWKTFFEEPAMLLGGSVKAGTAAHLLLGRMDHPLTGHHHVSQRRLVGIHLNRVCS